MNKILIGFCIFVGPSYIYCADQAQQQEKTRFEKLRKEAKKTDKTTDTSSHPASSSSASTSADTSSTKAAESDAIDEKADLSAHAASSSSSSSTSTSADTSRKEAGEPEAEDRSSRASSSSSQSVPLDLRSDGEVVSATLHHPYEIDHLVHLRFVTQILRKNEIKANNERTYLYLGNTIKGMKPEESITLVVKLKLLCSMQEKTEFTVTDIENAKSLNIDEINEMDNRREPIIIHHTQSSFTFNAKIFTAFLGISSFAYYLIGYDRVCKFFRALKNINFQPQQP